MGTLLALHSSPHPRAGRTADRSVQTAQEAPGYQLTKPEGSLILPCCIYTIWIHSNKKVPRVGKGFFFLLVNI